MNTYYRIYPNLSRSRPIHPLDSETAELIEYNRICRPGCAQVLNGKVVYLGYLLPHALIHIDPTVDDTIPGVNVAQAVEVMKTVPLPDSPNARRLDGEPGLNKLRRLVGSI